MLPYGSIFAPSRWEDEVMLNHTQPLRPGNLSADHHAHTAIHELNQAHSVVAIGHEPSIRLYRLLKAITSGLLDNCRSEAAGELLQLLRSPDRDIRMVAPPPFHAYIAAMHGRNGDQRAIVGYLRKQFGQAAVARATQMLEGSLQVT